MRTERHTGYRESRDILIRMGVPLINCFSLFSAAVNDRSRFRLLRWSSHFICVIVLVFSSLCVSSEDRYAICHPNYYFFPKCINRPDKYSCECGPGFSWNTKMCVANGLDSLFEFSSERPLRYSLLVNKPFPFLRSLSVSFWVRVLLTDHPGTILSYTDVHGTELFQFASGPTLRMRVHSDAAVSNIRLNASQWTHVLWTWSSLDGSWRLLVNGGPSEASGFLPRTLNHTISSGGELVLGQTSKALRQETRSREVCCAFLGDLGFVNVWRRVLDLDESHAVFADCTLMWCGDAIQWADFRSGTRGAMRIRWPTRIYDRERCYSDKDLVDTCDQYCSRVKGARCREEILNNIRWVRTPTDNHVMMVCPGRQTTQSNQTRFVHRRCLRTAQNEGVWSEPVLDYCISNEELSLKQQVNELLNGSPLNEHLIGHVLRMLCNRTSGQQYTNILDVATVIEMLRTIIGTQLATIERFSMQASVYKYGLSRSHDRTLYPSWTDTNRFAQLATEVIDNLLDERNEEAWEYSLPPGAEGDRLFQVIENLLDLLAWSIQFHVSRGDVDEPEMATISQQFNHIRYSVSIRRKVKLDALVFEDGAFKAAGNGTSGPQGLRASLRRLVSDTPHHQKTNRSHTQFETLSMGEYRASRILNKISGRENRDDCLNSPVLSFKIHPSHETADPIFHPSDSIQLVVSFPYIESFNVSNPDCIYIVHGNSTVPWKWTSDRCDLVSKSSQGVTCLCSANGFFALQTDMYDVNWTPEEEDLTFVTLPSYIGSSISILLCFLSFVLLFYFRTTSKTASLHKNFAVAIIGGKLAYIFGTEQIKNEMLCHVMAAALHYFFLATFCWLMNEAFNLYIVITYAAHARGGEQSDGGSLVRFHVLGWILPAVLVGAFIGAHTRDYFASNICWLSWRHIWLFLGPVIGIILVTMLVLIFTAKEQRESAYSKNERTNKTISVYTKALWTQTILLGVSWFFVILSVKMKGDIVKWLFALFDIMQGAFFFVFYFLLNDEVVTAYKAAMKRRDLSDSDSDASPNGSVHDLMTQQNAEAIEMMPNPGAHCLGVAQDNWQTEAAEQQSRLLVRKYDLRKAKVSNDDDDDGNDDGDDDIGATARRRPVFTTTEV